jgi:hypothetical protein
MAAEQGGPAVEKFPEATEEVWATVRFTDCPKDTQYSIRVYSAKTGNPEQIVGVSTWEGGTGSRSFRVTPMSGVPFEPGAYVTFLRIGPDDVVCDFGWWFVDVEAGGQQSALPRQYPVTGFGFGRQDEGTGDSSSEALEAGGEEGPDGKPPLPVYGFSSGR